MLSLEISILARAHGVQKTRQDPLRATFQYHLKERERDRTESEAEDLRIRSRGSLVRLQFQEMFLIPRPGFVSWIKNATTNKSLE